MKRNKGITLIALVITIIVLLILAGVAISMLSGENGILRKAAEAKTKTEEKSLEERIKIAAIGALDDKTLKINKEKLKEELKIGDEDIVEAGDNGYEVKVDGKTTYVSDDGKEIGELKEIDIILDEYFKSKNLPYKCRYGYVTGIGMEDTAVKLKDALKEKGYELRNIDTTVEVDNSDFPTTGMTVTTKNRDVVARVICFGDIDGNGNIDIDDIVDVQNAIKSVEGFEEYQLIAMDINHNGKIDNEDYMEVFNWVNYEDEENKINNQNYYATKINGIKYYGMIS